MRTPELKARRGFRWYLRQMTGESKWDEYLERCRHEGIEPMSRGQFERHRTEHREKHPQARCC